MDVLGVLSSFCVASAEILLSLSLWLLFPFILLSAPFPASLLEPPSHPLSLLPVGSSPFPGASLCFPSSGSLIWLHVPSSPSPFLSAPSLSATAFTFSSLSVSSSLPYFVLFLPLCPVSLSLGLPLPRAFPMG